MSIDSQLARAEAMTRSLLDKTHPLHQICWGYLLSTIDGHTPMVPIECTSDPVLRDIVVMTSVGRVLNEADRSPEARSALQITYERLSRYYGELSSSLMERLSAPTEPFL